MAVMTIVTRLDYVMIQQDLDKLIKSLGALSIHLPDIELISSGTP